MTANSGTTTTTTPGAGGRSYVFVDIDTQRDFLDPSGALYVPDATAIVPQLERLTRTALRQGIPIVATADAHRLDEEEPEPFPPHCLAGEPGQMRVAATAYPDSLVIAATAPGTSGEQSGTAIFGDGPLPAHVTLEKQRYDVFSQASADWVFARYAQSRPGVCFVVYGVATDYCVRAAVLGLLRRGYPVTIVTDAVRAVDPSGEPQVLQELVRNGATLTVTDRILASLTESG